MRNEGKDGNILLTGAIERIEDTVWVSLLEINGLVKINVKTGDIRFVDCFQNERLDYQLHTQIIFYRNKLFFVPWNAEHIAVYDNQKEELRYVSGYQSGKGGYFAAGLVNESDLYLVSAVSAQIIQVDMDSEKTVNKYELADYSQEEYSCLIPPMKSDNGIWKISEKKNEAWRFDFQNKKFIQCEHTFCDAKMIAGCAGKDCIWIIGNNSRLYQLSQECRYMAQYDIGPLSRQVLQTEELELLKCICSDQAFSIIFYNRNCMFKIPLVDNIPVIEEYELIEFESAFFPDNYNQMIIMLNNRVLIIEDGKETEITFQVNAGFFSDMLAKNKNRLKETAGYGAGLDQYIEDICTDQADAHLEGPRNERTAGKRIYDMVKEGPY